MFGGSYVLALFAPSSLCPVVSAIFLMALSLLSPHAHAGSYVLSCTGGTFSTAGMSGLSYRLNGTNYGGVGGSVGISGDMPSLSYSPTVIPGDSGGANWYTAAMQDSFTTWVICEPPAAATGIKGIIWVPLQKLAWSENITVSNTGGVWALNPGSAVTSAASGTNANDPPGWTTVDIGSQLQMRP